MADVPLPNDVQREKEEKEKQRRHMVAKFLALASGKRTKLVDGDESSDDDEQEPLKTQEEEDPNPPTPPEDTTPPTPPPHDHYVAAAIAAVTEAKQQEQLELEQLELENKVRAAALAAARATIDAASAKPPPTKRKDAKPPSIPTKFDTPENVAICAAIDAASAKPPPTKRKNAKPPSNPTKFDTPENVAIAIAFISLKCQMRNQTRQIFNEELFQSFGELTDAMTKYLQSRFHNNDFFQKRDVKTVVKRADNYLFPQKQILKEAIKEKFPNIGGRYYSKPFSQAALFEIRDVYYRYIQLCNEKGKRRMHVILEKDFDLNVKRIASGTAIIEKEWHKEHSQHCSMNAA